MPRKIAWTEDQHATIRRMIAADQNYMDVARIMRVARWTIREYARVHGIMYQPAMAIREVAWHDDLEREPLPPGHEITWSAIVAGTCLDGIGYPL